MGLPGINDIFIPDDSSFETIWQDSSTLFNYTILVPKTENAIYFINKGAQFIRQGNPNLCEDIILVEFPQELNFHFGKINNVTINSNFTTSNGILLNHQGEFLGMHSNSQIFATSNNLIGIYKFSFIIDSFINDLILI